MGTASWGYVVSQCPLYGYTSGRDSWVFFLAIVDPRGEDAIPVIDRHAGAVYLGESMTDKQQSKLSNVGVNTRIVHAYRLIAEQLNLHVHQLQATTWVEWRIEKGYATL